MPQDNPFEGRPLLELEAERARLEYELEDLRTEHTSAAIIEVENQLDQIAAEIRRIGHM